MSSEEKLQLEHNKLISKFCFEHKVNKEEASYYLTEANWDIEVATNEIKEDVAFEKLHHQKRVHPPRK